MQAAWAGHGMERGAILVCTKCWYRLSNRRSTRLALENFNRENQLDLYGVW